MIQRLWGIIVVLLALAGCTLIGESKPPPNTAHDTLAARLDETRRSQAAALNLWDRVIFGEIVSCQEVISVPELVTLSASDLETYPNARAIQEQLNTAIRAIRDSSDLWNIECNADRPLVPLSMAREGRSTALAASAPLDTAAALLNGES